MSRLYCTCRRHRWTKRVGFNLYSKQSVLSLTANGRLLISCYSYLVGMGYMQEYLISRFFIDARVQRIYGGTNEIMKEIVARFVLGKTELSYKS